jgi:predicted NUDIX family NTP pyrophosphohydrolase
LNNPSGASDGVRRMPATLIMPKTSAGLLMYRFKNGKLQVLLAHPGGPFFKHKDDDTWTIPKGEPDPGEDLFTTALREFAEETGLQPQGPYIPLQPIQQKGGKIVHAWAFAGDCDPATIRSNLIMIEWPPKSGREIQIPEIDLAEFFDVKVARKKIKAAQAAFIDELAEALKNN